MKYANGHIYVGEWLEGKRHGEGAGHDCDGSIYSGNWTLDKPDQKMSHFEVKLRELLPKPAIVSVTTKRTATEMMSSDLLTFNILQHMLYKRTF